MSWSEEEIIALRTQLDSILGHVKFHHESLVEGLDSRTDDIGIQNTVNFLIDEYTRFVDDYNKLVENRSLMQFTELEEFQIEDEPVTPSMGRGILKKMERNLEMATSVLETLEDKSVGTEKVARLTSLKDSITEKLTEDYPILSRNLTQAIDALEDGHPKPAAITSSIVVDHVTDELKSELQVGDWNEAITELEERNILDKETDGRINRALKESRNDLSHDLKVNPDIENSLLIISGAVQLLTQVKEIEDVDVKASE